MKSLPIIFFLFLLSFSFSASAQDSCNLRISLLTCSPGEELYSTFGHSALRVTNPVSGEDIVYNYGTFDFAEPGFYMKFVRGKLLYYLSTEDFLSFSESYRQENRTMIEQVLNLDCDERAKILSLLQQNLLPENRAYKYDFLFDNCTTRLRDIVEKVSDQKFLYPKIVADNTSFRNVIHVYLNSNNQLWSKFGIDLLLGSKTDKIMTNREAMFLPEYLMNSFDKTTVGFKNLVEAKSIIFKADEPVQNISLLDNPLFYTSLLFLLIVIFSFINNVKVQSVLKNFDSMFFFLVGLLGILMAVMWFGTDHVMCRNNYNLLWAIPTHVVAAFFLSSKKKWVKPYLLICMVLQIGTLLCWFILPQDLNAAIIPLILIMIFRSFFYIRMARKQNFTA